MNIQERYNRLTSKQKAQFSRLRRPSMETGWKKLTDEEILNMIERDAKPKVDNSKFARIACNVRFQSSKMPLLQKNTDYLKYYELK